MLKKLLYIFQHIIKNVVSYKPNITINVHIDLSIAILICVHVILQK